jgi:hypothetical protein
MTSLEEFSEKEKKDYKEQIIKALRATEYGQINAREELNKEIRKTRRLIKEMEKY